MYYLCIYIYIYVYVYVYVYVDVDVDVDVDVYVYVYIYIYVIIICSYEVTACLFSFTRGFVAPVVPLKPKRKPGAVLEGAHEVAGLEAQGAGQGHPGGIWKE